MLCACSGEQFKFEEPEPPHSPESLATRDFSASGLSSRTGDWESKFEDIQVDEAESTLKEALSLNYEEARALLGRLEFQRGNFDAALQVFQGIDIRSLTPRMAKAIVERIRQKKPRPKGDHVLPNVMSMHSVSLLIEAILLKARSLGELGKFIEAAKECKVILDTVESALPNGMLDDICEDCKLQDMFHKALELLPSLWIKAGYLDEAITAYRRALVKPWNLEPKRLADVQKNLACTLLYGGVEASLPPQLQIWGTTMPKNNTEEAILLLLILIKKLALREIKWDPEIMDHLTYALSVTGLFELLADHVEQALPGLYRRAERWYFLALCYSACGQNEVALNLLKKVAGRSEGKNKPHFPSFLLGAKLCSQDPIHAREGIAFSRKAIDLVNHQCEHFMGQVHKFLGVCYGGAARASVLDSERMFFQRESLNSLNHAVRNEEEDPEVMFSLGLENAVQRNLDAAFNNAMKYSDMMAGSSGQGWKLLALVVSAEQRFKDAETIVDFALDEAGRVDQLELLRLKAVLQVAQEHPKQAIETYRILLTLVQARRDLQAKNSEQEPTFHSKEFVERNLEKEAWRDLATIYTKLGLWTDAEICVNKAKLIEFYSAHSWHTTEPDYVPSIVSTAEVLMKLGSQSLPIARSFLMNALRLEPTNHEAWLNLGLISKREGSLQQAADFFQAAHELQLSAPVQSFV
ncbi:protein NPGR1 [Prunus yedoensis var. nudiflora]|uniref:Protein NPGR1 n=1 Tax=Prunus yedoensis var. nudiflora TaxID=2094558 RepID=A0A314XM60_PRUYE|nr:protein NPGR1 [Prunus yedoensis var. nudiflora]